MTVGMVDSQRFAEMLSARAETADDPAHALCLACLDVLDLSGAGLVLMSDGHSPTRIGVSDDVTNVVEQLEYTLGDGPCIAAFTAKAPVFEPDLADGTSLRSREFRRGALDAGMKAAFGFPLLVQRVCIGALNLYRTEAGALSNSQIGDALVVAAVASAKVLEWQAAAPPGDVAWQLERFPKHQMVAHQAAGRISVQADVSVADAHVLLRAYAFAHDRLIADVARAVAAGEVRFDEAGA